MLTLTSIFNKLTNMKLSTLSSKLKLFNVGSNAKTKKGDDEENLTAIMYLASSDISGYDVCEQASPQCKAMCLYTAGRGVFTNVQQARINRTKLFFEKNKEFLELLFKEITIFEAYCKEHEVQGNVRLNGTSDLNFINLVIKDDKDIFQLFPELNFYDYTKDYSRETSYDNYYLLYSRTEETSLETVRSLVDADKNVAVVFDEVPEEWHSIKVINGDINDLRLNDESGVIVGLKAKAKAKRSKREIVPNERSFVISTIDIT